MTIVIVRPYDNKDILDPYVVEYRGEKKNPDFETDWDACIEKAKEINEENWNIVQIINLMEKKGWSLLSVDHTFVTY